MAVAPFASTSEQTEEGVPDSYDALAVRAGITTRVNRLSSKPDNNGLKAVVAKACQRRTKQSHLITPQ
jgi:hypothetical protein